MPTNRHHVSAAAALGAEAFGAAAAGAAVCTVRRAMRGHVPAFRSAVVRRAVSTVFAFVAGLVCVTALTGCGETNDSAIAKPASESPTGTAPLISLAWSDTAGGPVAGASDGRVYVWENGTASPAEFDTQTGQPITALRVSSDGFIGTGTAGGSFVGRQWGKPQTDRIEKLGAAVADIAFHPRPEQNLQMVLALADGKLLFIDSNRGTQRVDSGRRAGIRCLSYSPNGQWLISGSGDGAVIWWRSSTQKAEAVATGHTAAVGGLQFSPDGRRIASGDWNGGLKLWDSASRRAVADWTQPDAVSAVLWTRPDVLVTASWDGKLRVWQVPAVAASAGTPSGGVPRAAPSSAAGAKPNTEAAPTLLSESNTGRTIEAAQLNADRTQVLTVGEDNTLRHWLLPPIINN